MTRARNRSRAAALALALVCGAGALGSAAARAGTIYLLNGEELDGEIVGVNAEEVTLRYPYGTQRIALREIRDVELHPGDSIWADQVQKALENSRHRMAEESAKKIAERLAEANVKLPPKPPAPPPQAPVSSLAPSAAAAAKPSAPAPPKDEGPTLPTAAELREHLLGAKLESARYGFLVRFPGTWAGREEDTGFFTFRDPNDTARANWSFNVTALDEDEAGYAAVVDGATKALSATAGYTSRTRAQPLRVGHFDGQRSIGVVSRGRSSVRLDQVILKTRRGVLIFDFFTPGGTLDDNGAPDVDGVLEQIEWR